MKNLYKCNEHKLDVICLGCAMAIMNRHDMMLEFIKQLSILPSGMGDEISDYAHGAFSQNKYIAMQAKTLLNEIGKNSG